MSFFGSSKKSTSAVLVDISSSSVGVAYARITPGAPAAIIFNVRTPIETHAGDLQTPFMLRALDATLRTLREQGAPILHRRTGSGSVQNLYTHIGAPWQSSTIHLETFTDEKPFTFTESLLEKAKKQVQIPPGRFQTEETVLGCVLNGYETAHPVGKKVKHADVLVLNASMDDETAKLIRRALGSFAASREIRFSSLPTLALSTVPRAFPHEKDYMMVRVSGSATELVFVKRGFPVHAAAIPQGLQAFAEAARSSGYHSFPDGGASVDHTKEGELDAHFLEAKTAWTGAFRDALKTFTAAHALPRTLFLIADPEAQSFVRTMLDVPEIHALWLSDEPLAIIALVSKHFAANVGHEPDVADDLMLDMLSVQARN